MTEEIITDYRQTVQRLQEELKEKSDMIFKLMDYVARLEQENKSLYEEKNCLHKIIDRLLENAGYSKNIASAEDFEDVYEDMQRKINEFAELEQENKELKEENSLLSYNLHIKEEEAEHYLKEVSKYRSALEEIRNYCDRIEQGSVIGTQDCLINSIKNITNEVLNS